MPLLKRKAFEKSTASEFIRDDDEVFHCEITDEIFKDYEEYCERIILVNSMVWTCEMTGKNNLTYAEALESEKAAIRSLKDFPMELRTPILFLASKTKRCSFAEMSEDVFNYVRERYFIGETVEACLEGDTWCDAHILLVTAPKQHPGSKATLPASSYCYEVEQYDESDPAAIGQVGTAPFDRMRRRKGVYTREKNRLFLKQFVEQGFGGIISIKKSALDKYNISKVNFDQLFTGPVPEFPSSKKLIKNSISPAASKKKPSPDKKKQESIDKFLKKIDKTEVPKPKAVNEFSKKNAEAFAEQMRRAGEQMKEKKIEEKEKLKEKNARLQAYLKEWQKVKEDLDLEDHKIIPKGTPIELEGISQAHFGDFLSVLEFVHLYGDILKTKNVFHNGLDLDTFRKALTLKEHAGVFSDLVQMLLTTIFSLQEDEAEEYNEGGGMAKTNEVVMEDGGEVGVTKAVELATKACKWSQTYLGTPLRKLPLDPTTVTEVLRLHLLSSGAAAGTRCAAWRYQQRGGYSSHDDAGLRLRRAHPALLRRLHSTHIADLPMDEKFKVLQCLMNQILSYATVRDIIEEKLETWRLSRHELRMSQIALRKHEAEQMALRSKLKKEATAKKEALGNKSAVTDEELKVALEKLAKEGAARKADLEKKVKQLQSKCFDYQSYLGSDRGYRRYWLHQSVPGLFVEAGAEARGTCRDKPVLPCAAARDDGIAYVKSIFEKERASSDKENDSRHNSPKKGSAEAMRALHVCTGTGTGCPVHSPEGRPAWAVYHTEEGLDALVQALNRRGLRESELRHSLEADRQNIVDYIKKCPLHLLNPLHGQTAPPPPTRHKKFQPSLVVPPDCSLSEALELSLRDHILELEHNIFHGCLGSLKVKDREAWRGTILLRSYDQQEEYLSWGPQRRFRDHYLTHNGHTQEDDKDDIKTIPENKYRDPGYYLNDAGKVNGVKSEPSEDTESKAASPEVVRGLTCALLQVSQAIHHKYIKRPLGLDEKERKDYEAKGKPLVLDALERWEVSLMECRSFAQIVVHLFTLDSSVTWSASVLNASCRVCRRKTDPDNMLLCDACNKGHHLYCLKPKLTRVPQGDWFCEQCKPKERTPRKRRKLFSDEDLEEAMKSESEEEEEQEEDSEDEEEKEVSREDSEGSEDIELGLCAACGSGGRLAARCGGCARQWHVECAGPRGLCAHCKAPTRDSEESEDNVLLVKLKRGRRPRVSKEASPVHNGVTNGHRPHSSGKQSRKSKEMREKSVNRRSRKSGSNTPTASDNRRQSVPSKRRRVPAGMLDTAALEELLRDVMRHRDSWPFLEPVSQEEVPDYFDVIEQPMDLTTIKQKLGAGEYRSGEQLMADAALVFTNCYTYNMDTHEVAKAGIRLQKYFSKRCADLELPGLPQIDWGLFAPPNNGGCSEATSDHDDRLPKAKRTKLTK